MTGFSSSCGACKFLRRRCTSECVFAPYFSYDHAASHFSAVHKVFGASNVSKLLLHLPVENRSDAAITLSYEALARMHDPVYGCVAQILALQKLVSNLEEEIEFFGNQMANLGVNPCSYEMYPETNILNEALQFSSEYDIMGNYINQQNLQLQQTPNILANQLFCSQMNVQLPQGNFFENEILQAHCNSSAIDGHYEEVHQDIYLPSQWMSAA